MSFTVVGVDGITDTLRVGVTVDPGHPRALYAVHSQKQVCLKELRGYIGSIRWSMGSGYLVKVEQLLHEANRSSTVHSH